MKRLRCPKKYCIWVCWGEEQDPSNIEKYTFNTQEERSAFIEGVDAGNGWLAWDFAMTHKALLKQVKENKS